MQDQISETIAQPLAPSSPAVKLWTPGFIAGTTFLLGFPAGIVLASINWVRMKLNNKALTHLIGGAVITIIVVILLLFLPGNGARAVGISFNLVVLFYLQRQMQKDLENFKVSHTVEKANELGGCLIGLGILLLFLISMFLLGIVLALLGIPIPE